MLVEPVSQEEQILSPVDSGLQLGTRNWTFEFWYRRNVTVSFSAIVQMGTGADLYSMLVGYHDGGNLNFYISTSGSGWAVCGASMGAPDAADFHHYSLSFNGSNVYAHRDGTLISTTAFSGTVYQNANSASIGKSSGGFLFNGYLQDLRIYKGVAKYGASSFTPPDSIIVD